MGWRAVLLLVVCAWAAAAEETSIRRLTQWDGKASAPAFSPEGSRILFVAAGAAAGLYVMAADGTQVRRIAAGPAQRAYWSPVGRAAAYGGCGWSIVEIESGALLYQRVFNCLSGGRPSWAPDGRRFAVLVEKGDVSSAYTLDIFEAGGSASVTVAAEQGAVQHFNRLPAWDPSGERLAYASSLVHDTEGGIHTEEAVFVSRLDGSQRRRVVSRRWLTQAPASPREHNRFRIKQLAWSPDGTRLGYVGSRGASDFDLVDGEDELFVVNLASGLERVLSPAAGRIGDLAFAPDGRRLLFDLDGDLYVVGVGGGGLQRLTAHPAADGPADWSPDGRLVVFASGRDGDGDIYIMPVDGATGVKNKTWGETKEGMNGRRR